MRRRPRQRGRSRRADRVRDGNARRPGRSVPVHTSTFGHDRRGVVRGMMVPEPPEKVWVDEEAGPVVRHYAMTAGRTRPPRGEFDLITLIVAARSITGGDTGP